MTHQAKRTSQRVVEAVTGVLWSVIQAVNPPSRRLQRDGLLEDGSRRQAYSAVLHVSEEMAPRFRPSLSAKLGFKSFSTG